MKKCPDAKRAGRKSRDFNDLEFARVREVEAAVRRDWELILVDRPTPEEYADELGRRLGFLVAEVNVRQAVASLGRMWPQCAYRTDRSPQRVRERREARVRKHSLRVVELLRELQRPVPHNLWVLAGILSDPPG